MSMRHSAHKKMSRVDTVGKTLNKLKDYLSRFWEYYKTSPALRKALVNT